MKWYIMLGSLLLLFNHSVLSGSLWPPGRQYARLPCLSLSPGVCIDSMMPSNHPSSVTPFSSCPQSFPASGSFPMSQLFKSGSPSIETSPSVFRMNIQGWFPLGWLVWSPCFPRNSQESSPAQFKSISSSLLRLLYGPTLTSIHDYWKNHSFD